MYTLLADVPPDAPLQYHIWPGSLSAVVYGLIGIVLLLLGYKLFDIITPHIHIQNELKANNTAVGIVIGALLLGIAYVVAHVVGG